MRNARLCALKACPRPDLRSLFFKSIKAALRFYNASAVATESKTIT
ncbi:hypothetical protein [uncultured Helicobacter sp.]